MCKWAERAWSRLFAAIALALACSCALAAASHVARFGFGQTATADMIAGWDIDVRPDGQGLPAGKGNVQQGQALYDAHCASCHGTFGESNSHLQLAGGVGSLGTDQPVRTTGSKLKYATPLFDYIRRAMPFDAPQSLTGDEVYALTAYVLYLNDIVPSETTLDRESLPKLRMPNRDGFTIDHGFMSKDGKPDTHNTACMRDCLREVRVVSELPDHALHDHGLVSDQQRSFATVVLAEAGPSGSAHALAQRSGCLACHAPDQRLVGPAFRDVAARYKAEASPGVHDRLAEKLRSGGACAWGDVAMPAQKQLAPDDALLLIRWVLLGAP